MHELARVRKVLSAAIELAKGRNIRGIELNLGASHADEAEFRDLFQANAVGTPAEGAELRISFIGSSYTCNDCKNAEKDLPFDPIRCSKCGSADIEESADFEITGMTLA